MLRKEMISALIFDLDGVLFDTEKMKERRKKVIAEALGLDLAKLDFRGRHYKEAMQLIGISGKKIRAYKNLWEELRKEDEGQNRILFRRASTLFRSLKNHGKKIGIITNREISRLTLQNIFLGLNPAWIDFLLFHCPRHRMCWEKLKIRYTGYLPPHNYLLSRYAKPNPLMAEGTKDYLRDLPGYPRSVYYVGDNVNDCRFARGNKFGFIGVMSGSVKNKKVWKENGAKIVVDNIGDLLKIFPDF